MFASPANNEVRSVMELAEVFVEQNMALRKQIRRNVDVWGGVALRVLMAVFRRSV